jgi:hypothetical protein
MIFTWPLFSAVGEVLSQGLDAHGGMQRLVSACVFAIWIPILRLISKGWQVAALAAMWTITMAIGLVGWASADRLHLALHDEYSLGGLAAAYIVVATLSVMWLKRRRAQRQGNRVDG